MLLLSACATARSEPPRPPPPAGFCPPLAAYDAAFQARLAGELEGLAPTSAIRIAIADYGALRDQLRACRSVTPTPP
jgi:hypothetical protein